ncbi:MAG TPA: 2-hydroxyacyl-CoA dehydratase family protein [bacterium]|nr:2-hydroxyacyl-CoA dehydratase family protein [bacterium]
MTALDQLHALAQQPTLNKDERPLIAVFPMWFPYEILLAGGVRASEWWGFPVASTLADAHFPPYICSFVKSTFEMLLAKRIDADGMVFASATCDSIQNSAGIYRYLFPEKFSAYFRMTQNPDSPAARPYLRGEIARVIEGIEAFTGKSISKDDLQQAIAVADAFRAAVRALLEKLAAGKTSLPAADIYRAIQGALADIGPATTALLNEVTASIQVENFTGPKVMLVGMTAAPFDALQAVEDAGGHIVGDDLGLGWRTMAVDCVTNGDPLEAIVNRLLAAPPCSSLHHADRRRAQYVLERAQALKADGVIFTRLKFCDPEAFDYPDIKCLLDEAKIANLLLERDLVDKVEGAAATRLEAFLEQIGEGV